MSNKLKELEELEEAREKAWQVYVKACDAFEKAQDKDWQAYEKACDAFEKAQEADPSNEYKRLKEAKDQAWNAWRSLDGQKFQDKALDAYEEAQASWAKALDAYYKAKEKTNER